MSAQTKRKTGFIESLRYQKHYTLDSVEIMGVATAQFY